MHLILWNLRVKLKFQKMNFNQFFVIILFAGFANCAAVQNSSVKAGILGDEHRWGGGIYFQIDSAFTGWERDRIVSALSELLKYACIKVEWGSNPPASADFVYIEKHATLCDSFVGRIGGRQILHLSQSCFSFEAALHEAYHAIGFYHEVSRADRDSYVTVNWQNIAPDDRNFDIQVDSDTFGVGYDYYSIVHYPAVHHSINGQPTLTSKNPSITDFGSKGYLTRKDKQRLQRMYNCPDISYITIFEHIHQGGALTDIRTVGNDCHPLPDGWNDRVSSVNTHNNCFFIYEHITCTGRVIRVEPGTPNHDDFTKLDFNDIASAIKPCPY